MPYVKWHQCPNITKNRKCFAAIQLNKLRLSLQATDLWSPKHVLDSGPLMPQS